MSTPTDESIPAACDYCGRKNPDRLHTCPGCYTPLVSAPKGKSKALAIILALVFGPLGLLYVKAWQTACIMILIALPFVLSHTGGLWFTVGSRVICAVWAYRIIIEQDKAPNSKRDSARLLDEAARLEETDRSKAIALYEEIVKRYPHTSASREAARNIRTMTGAQAAARGAGDVENKV